jgi:hypothetical protein
MGSAMDSKVYAIHPYLKTVESLSARFSVLVYRRHLGII